MSGGRYDEAPPQSERNYSQDEFTHWHARQQERMRERARQRAIQDAQRRAEIQRAQELWQEAQRLRWQWRPQHSTPRPPQQKNSAPHGDFPDLLKHLGRIRAAGATIAESEQAYLEGVSLISQRASTFPGNRGITNEFLGPTVGGWRVYGGDVGQNGLRQIVAFNYRTGVIVSGEGHVGATTEPGAGGVPTLHFRRATTWYPPQQNAF